MGTDGFPPGPARSSGPSPETPQLIAPASEIGRYEEVRLSRGRGRQQWFEAEDRWDGEVVSVVAVDVVEPRRSQIGDLQVATRVDHAAVVRPRQLARGTTGWLLVTDHVQGEPLDELIARHGPVRGDRLIVLAADLFAGLAAVHRVGIAHGNVDGSHVVVGPQGQIQIIGLGLAAIDPTARPSPQADLRDVVRLLDHVAGDRPPPAPLARVLDRVAAGTLDAPAARDELLPPVGAADASPEHVDTRAAGPLAPRPWWVRALAAVLVAMALGGLVLVATSLLTGGDEVGPPTAVPDVVGSPLTSAQQAMDRAGFTIDVQLQAAPDSSAGEVVSQEPRGGVDAPRGSRVVVVVATSGGAPP